MKKIGLTLLSIIIAVFAFLFIYIQFVLPKVGVAEDITIEITPERVERGAYLANAVMVCMDCHSERDWNLYSGPPVDGTLGQGGEVFDQKMGFPGYYTAKNITPYGIGEWTDGQLLQAITEGVNPEGQCLFPIMPHPVYGTLDREDMYDVIAYLRQLKSIEHTVPQSKPDFPMQIILKLIPKQAEFSTRPAKTDATAYGEYLFKAASCTDCHTIMEKGKYVEDMYLAGGFEFPMPSGVVRSMNITPDLETGIGKWSKDYFVQRFKMYSDSSYVVPAVSKEDFNTIMPWMMYSQMTEEDLGAIYEYLQTVEPIKNQVERFTPAQ